MWFFDSPIIAILALITSVAFSAVAAIVPPSGGNFIAVMFLSGMASFLGGEDKEEDAYEQEIADEDI